MYILIHFLSIRKSYKIIFYFILFKNCISLGLNMIERYSRKEMVQIWSQEEKFNIWFQIEAHACDAQAELGVIPKVAAKVIWEKGKFDIDKIDEIEKTTKHDVKILSDGWTAVTRDKSLSAQFEHSIGVTSNGYEVFTNSPKGYTQPEYPI